MPLPRSPFFAILALFGRRKRHARDSRQVHPLPRNGINVYRDSRSACYQLDRHFPRMKERYIRTFGNRRECPSPNAPRLERILWEACRKRGVLWEPEAAMGWLMEFEDPRAGQQLK